MKRSKLAVLLTMLAICLLSACERQNATVCTPEVGTPRPTVDLASLLRITPTPGPSPTPVKVEIGGKMMLVDRVVAGPFCNEEWSGTVYVNCDAQIAPWDDEENPLFMEGCNLNIEPNTVVYVAAHNDAPYYQGCSCHTGDLPTQ